MRSRIPFYILLGALGLLSTAMLLPVFIPVTVAVIVGYLLFPLYDAMATGLRSPDLRAALLVVLVLLVLALPVLLVVVQVADDIPHALRTTDLSQVAEKINGWLDARLGRHIPLSENLAVYLARVREAALRAVPGILGAVGNTAVALFVMLYTMYYVLRDGRRIWENFILIVPLEEEVKPLLTMNLQQTLSGVLYGQLITAVIQAVLAGLGYVIFHIPHALFWSFVTLLFCMVPLVGSAFVFVPLAISRLVAGDAFGGWGLLIYGAVVVAQIDNVVKPRLIAGRSQLHPLAALLGVVGGIQLFGVIGFVVGPVLLGLVVAMLRFHRDMVLRQQAQAAASSQAEA